MIKTEYFSEREFRELSTGVNYNHVRQKQDCFFSHSFPSIEDYANMRLWVFLHARWFDSSSFFLSNELFTKVQFLLSQPLWRFKDDAISSIFHLFLCPCLCLTQTMIHHTCDKESIVLACFVTESDYEFIHEIQNLPLTCVDYPTIPRVSTNPIKCQLPL